MNQILYNSRVTHTTDYRIRAHLARTNICMALCKISNRVTVTVSTVRRSKLRPNIRHKTNCSWPGAWPTRRTLSVVPTSLTRRTTSSDEMVPDRSVMSDTGRDVWSRPIVYAEGADQFVWGPPSSHIRIPECPAPPLTFLLSKRAVVEAVLYILDILKRQSHKHNSNKLPMVASQRHNS